MRCGAVRRDQLHNHRAFLAYTRIENTYGIRTNARRKEAQGRDPWLIGWRGPRFIANDQARHRSAEPLGVKAMAAEFMVPASDRLTVPTYQRLKRLKTELLHAGVKQ